MFDITMNVYEEKREGGYLVYKYNKKVPVCSKDKARESCLEEIEDMISAGMIQATDGTNLKDKNFSIRTVSIKEYSVENVAHMYDKYLVSFSIEPDDVEFIYVEGTSIKDAEEFATYILHTEKNYHGTFSIIESKKLNDSYIDYNDIPDRKPLYDKFGRYNEDGRIIIDIIKREIYPIVEDMYEKGYNKVELLSLIHDTLQFEFVNKLILAHKNVIKVYHKGDYNK